MRSSNPGLTFSSFATETPPMAGMFKKARAYYTTRELDRKSCLLSHSSNNFGDFDGSCIQRIPLVDRVSL